MPPQPRRLVTVLLDWFAAHARALPWRSSRDPYAIWISEVMLQQTQVKTVIPYWERWMRSLPDVPALAKASEARILKLWEGLGYYTRARNLQRAAREILARHGGKIPDRREDLLTLPGIGRYTAGAISSIAFNQPAPILDGNVIRVLSRVFAIRGNPRERTTNQRLWQLAATLVATAADTRRPDACSHLNQALMELGALVCMPRQADCPACPCRRLCGARRDGLVDRLPNLAPRPRTTARHFFVFVFADRRRWLVRQRPAGQVNAGLWEFPTVEASPTTRPREAVAGLLSGSPGISRDSGNQPFNLTPLGKVSCGITRYRLTLECYAVTPARSSRLPCPVPAHLGRWRSVRSLDDLAFSSGQRAVLRLARKTILGRPRT